MSSLALPQRMTTARWFRLPIKYRLWMKLTEAQKVYRLRRYKFYFLRSLFTFFLAEMKQHTANGEKLWDDLRQEQRWSLKSSFFCKKEDKERVESLVSLKVYSFTLAFGFSFQGYGWFCCGSFKINIVQQRQHYSVCVLKYILMYIIIKFV